MSKIVHVVVGAFAFVGIVATALSFGSLVYADRKLHEASRGYKYGPARHIAYYSDIMHRTSRDIDSAAVEMYRKSTFDDQFKYDQMVDARDSASDATLPPRTDTGGRVA
jgi:hypothetical protein